MQDRQVRERNFKDAHVLVIDQSEGCWRRTRKAMAQCLPGVMLSRVTSRTQLVKLLTEWVDDERTIPKLVLLDLYLPNRMDGLHVLSTIRQLDEPFNQVPIVVFSKSDLPTDINDAYRLGCSSYMIKPTCTPHWYDLFKALREFWWETTALPLIRHVF